jgi:hypothetical protein
MILFPKQTHGYKLLLSVTADESANELAPPVSVNQGQWAVYLNECTRSIVVEQQRSVPGVFAAGLLAVG